MILDLSGYLWRTAAAVRSCSLRSAARCSLTFLGCLILLPMNGCLGHHYVKTDFKSYENAFAETSNRELLLNLARLENRDPAYFFKMGQITSSYRMQGSLTTSGQLSAITSPEGQVPTGGGSPGIIFENDPTFQYIPVNDDTNARLLMAPIQPETFYALYEQGWRLDQLFRLLVDRIEVSQTNKSGVCSVEIFHNTPPVGMPNPGGMPGPSVSQDGRIRYDAVALSHYVSFLRVSALVYEMQKSGILMLRGTDKFVPYDEEAFIPVKSGESSPPRPSPWWAGNRGAAGGGNEGEGGSGGGGSVLQAKDQNDAIARKDIWERKMSPDGKTQVGWILGHKVFSAVFYLSPLQGQTDKNGVTTYSSNPGTVRDELENDLGPDDRDWKALKAGQALNTMLQIMSGGFSLEGTPAPGRSDEGVCPAPGAAPVAHLYMRSIIEIMAASAQEERPFEVLMKKENDPLVPDDPQKPDQQYQPRPFTAEVPRLEQIPVMRLQWQGTDTVRSLVTVSYRDTTFAVTDEKNPEVLANASWNRDMFRLIEGLSSQVTVDISKFPLPEILQLHSD
jgi:hypothetical protein